MLSFLLIIEFLIDPAKNKSLISFIILLIFIITYVLMNTLLIHGLRLSKGSEFFTSIKYTTSSLKSNDIISIADQIYLNLKNSRSFLKPNYSLDQLSEELSIPKSNISQVLNEYFEKSFFEFINTMRVEEAIMMIKKDSNHQLSIKEIMYASGFNSKSTLLPFYQ